MVKLTLQKDIPVIDQMPMAIMRHAELSGKASRLWI
jgi:hypothetical protein